MAAAAGSQLILRCPVGGYPINNITWSHGEYNVNNITWSHGECNVTSITWSHGECHVTSITWPHGECHVTSITWSHGECHVTNITWSHGVTSPSSCVSDFIWQSNMICSSNEHKRYWDSYFIFGRLIVSTVRACFVLVRTVSMSNI